MPSRASVVNLSWGQLGPTYGKSSERFAAPAGSSGDSVRRERQFADPDAGLGQLDEEPCDVESSSSTVDAYNEVAFRYFLNVEEKRFRRSNHRFLLLLVELNRQSGDGGQFEPALSKKLFAALSPCVRETDFIGWYRQAQVIGVVCTQLDDTQGTNVSDVMVDRLQKAMRDEFPKDIADRMHVRSYFLPSNGVNRS